MTEVPLRPVRTDREMYEQFYDRQVDRVVQQINDTARRVLQEAKGGNRRGHDFTAAAADAVHALQWGIANVPLESLIRAASDVDRNPEREKQ